MASRKTSAGNQLHVATRQAFTALEMGFSSISPAANQPSVTISLSMSLAITWLVPRLPEFRQQFPAIAVYLDTNDEVVDLNNSQVDVALRFGNPDREGLHYERLTREELIVVASPKLVMDKKLPMSPESIIKLPLLEDDYTPAWDKWASLVGIEMPKPALDKLTFMNSAVLIAAISDSQGVAPVRRLLLADDLDAGRLVRLDDTAIPLDSSLYFVCRDGEQNREPVQCVKRWLLSIPV